jgi:hypothetical protein
LPRVNRATISTNPTESKRNQLKASHTIVLAMAISSWTHLGGGPSLAAEVGMTDGTRHPAVACAASLRMPLKKTARANLKPLNASFSERRCRIPN